jgi:hypothetical protein
MTHPEPCQSTHSMQVSINSVRFSSLLKFSHRPTFWKIWMLSRLMPMCVSVGEHNGSFKREHLRTRGNPALSMVIYLFRSNMRKNLMPVQEYNRRVAIFHDPDLYSCPTRHLMEYHCDGAFHTPALMDQKLRNMGREISAEVVALRAIPNEWAFVNSFSEYPVNTPNHQWHVIKYSFGIHQSIADSDTHGSDRQMSNINEA